MSQSPDLTQAEPLRYAVDRVRSGHSLSVEETADAWRVLMSGNAPDGLIGALLGILATRIPTGEELYGACSIMNEFVHEVHLQGDRRDFLDTCGTGGAPKTFNVSKREINKRWICQLLVRKQTNQPLCTGCSVY